MISKRILNALIEYINDAVVVAGPEGKVLHLNSSAEELYGYSKGETWNLQSLSFNPSAGESKNQGNTAPASQNVKDVETTRRSRDGRFIEIYLTLIPVMNENGEPLAVVDISRDRRQERRSDALDRLSTQAQIALTVAHDLRNPLAILANIAYLLENRFDPKHIEMMKRQISHSESILSNLLDFTGARTSQRKELLLSDLMQEVLTLINLPANVEVEIVKSDPVYARIDPGQIKQVMINLLRNAAEAMEKRKGKIEIRILESEGFARVDVCDNGPGIAESVLKHMFEPMITTKETGLGFGLTACKQMIEANQGKITFESIRNQGSVFSVFLPKPSVTSENELL